MKKRVLSLTVAALVVAMLSTTAFAEHGGGGHGGSGGGHDSGSSNRSSDHSSGRSSSDYSSSYDSSPSYSSGRDSDRSYDDSYDSYTPTPVSWDQGSSAPVNRPSATRPADEAEVTMLSRDTLRAYADEVFQQVNTVRAQAGLAALERDAILDEAAMTRALECVAMGDIRLNGQAHTRPDGSEWYTVLDDLGVQRTGSGENLAGGYSTPTAAMNAWMNSTEGHREAILAQAFTKIGIGVGQDENGRIYWAQTFLLPN